LVWQGSDVWQDLSYSEHDQELDLVSSWCRAVLIEFRQNKWQQRFIGTSTPGKNDTPGGTAGPLSSGRAVVNYDLEMPFYDGKKSKDRTFKLYIFVLLTHKLSMCHDK
jgi:hypothetical protein